MNDKKIKFRSSMSGYNKADVNGYIADLNAKYYESDAENQRRIRELETRVKELEEEIAHQNGVELEALREKLEKADNLVVEMNGVIDRLNEEKEAAAKDNAELVAKLAEYEKNAEANTEIYEKSSKYDKVSEQIGSMIVSANAKAESIVSEAEIKAKIASKAMIDMTVEKLNDLNEKYTGEILTKAVQLTEELRTLSLATECFRTNIKTSVEVDSIKMKESLDATKRVIMEDNND